MLPRAVTFPMVPPPPGAREGAIAPDSQPAVFSGRKLRGLRGMDRSFGYNRLSREEDFLSQEDLIHGLVDIVSKNGNLLLNVGPRGEDAAIPEPQLRRLEWLGRWMACNGEALYGTRPWRRAEGRSREGVPLRFTSRDEALFAIALGPLKERTLTLAEIPIADGARVALLGDGPVAWRREGSGLRVELPVLPDAPAHAISMSPVRPR